MAKLHFFYSTMNAGKSTSLLQSNYNYKESGLDTMIFLPNETSKLSKGKIVSRIGVSAKAGRGAASRHWLATDFGITV